MTHFAVVPQVETDLQLRVSQALADSGQAWARITVEGRDLLLHGTAPDQAALESALQAAASADGVRKVNHDVVLRVAPVN